jgi:hypothetical protein
MDPFLVGVLWFSAVIFVMSLWALICNERTLRQKMKALHEAKNIAQLDMVSEVSYNKHMFYLMAFRSPKKLYNEQVRGYF